MARNWKGIEIPMERMEHANMARKDFTSMMDRKDFAAPSMIRSREIISTKEAALFKIISLSLTP